MYRPQLSYYHPNAKGTGSAVSFELNPATPDSSGCIFASFAAQKTISTRIDGRRAFATFDWANKIVLKLDIGDLSQMLLVFHGIQESILDGKGLYHASVNGNAIIRLEHRLEPMYGYVFEVSKKTSTDEDVRRVSLFLTPAEAFGLASIFEHSLGLLAFGVPPPLPMPVGANSSMTLSDSEQAAIAS